MTNTATIICALTLWWEGRGEGFTGLQLIADTIHNRQRGVYTADYVCRKPKQYSCWNGRTTVPEIPWNDPVFTGTCIPLAKKLVEGTYVPSTKATHYCRYDVFPSWRNTFALVIKYKNHVFYKEKS